jgi:hypothetical protein
MFSFLKNSFCQRVCLFCFLQIAVIQVVYAQYKNWNDYNFEGPFEKELRLFREAFDKGNYQEADQYFQKLIENHPKAGEVVYRNGSEMYAKMAEQTENENSRKYYTSTSLALFDSVLHYTKDTVNVLNRKLSRAVQLTFSYPTLYDEVLPLFDRTVEQLGHQTAYYNLVPYVAFANKAYEIGRVDKAYLLEVLNKVKYIAHANIDQSEYAHKYLEAEEKIDKILKE